jgi:hypothetical protein
MSTDHADPTIEWGAIGIVYACGHTPAAIRLVMKKLGCDWKAAITEMRNHGAKVEAWLDDAEDRL